MSSSNDIANRRDQLHPSHDPESERQPVSRPTKQLKFLRSRAAALGRACTDRCAGSGAPISGGPLNLADSLCKPSYGRSSRITLAGLITAAVVACAWPFVGGAPTNASAADDPCVNADFRTGGGQNLPDCRAYELVTPPELKTIPQIGPDSFGGTAGAGDRFNSPPATPTGDGFMFQVAGSALPGLPANGRLNQYSVDRDAHGWTSSPASPDGTQVDYPLIGGFSADHGYAASVATRKGQTTPRGSLDLDPSVTFPATNWIRYPDESYHLAGEGTIPADPDTDGYDNGFADDIHGAVKWISAGGEHIIVATDEQAGTPIQLTEDAPPNGTQAVYDRTSEGLDVVSLLPGDVTPAEPASFQGSSEDGTAVLFTVGTRGVDNVGAKLYARVNNAETLKLATNGTLPSGGTLRCTAGPSSASTMDYQWLRNGSPIAGETGDTYTPTAADEGKVVQCQTFVSNANAGATQVSYPGVTIEPEPGTAPPRSGPQIAAPSQSATLTVGGAGGQTLTCNPNSSGAWKGSPTFNYQWYRNGVPLSGNGANTDTYTVQTSDLAEPAVFQCAATGTNAGGTQMLVSLNRATSPAPSGPAAPTATATLSDPLVLGGIAADGSAAYYGRYGNIYSVDTSTGDETLVVGTGDAYPVLISPDGDRLFFRSGQQLDGPSNGSVGGNNLYVTNGGDIEFIGELTDADILSGGQSGGFEGGLGQAPAVAANTLARLLSATVSPNGNYLTFNSNAQLTGYDNAGKREVYLFDASSGDLTCVSCRPNGSPPSADSSLSQAVPNGKQEIGYNAVLRNVSDDGQVVFQSDDAILPHDSNGVADVYRWKGGDISLISSGTNSQASNLAGVDEDGSNIFFSTAEKLVPNGQDSGLRAIYDARVNGGIPGQLEVDPPDCQGDACQDDPTVPPADDTPGSVNPQPGNVQVRTARCNKLETKAGKAKRKARRLQKRAKRANSKHRRKVLRRKAGKQKRRASRLNARRNACRRGGSK